MFKTALACAALAIASAQNLQDLANQANAALAPVLNQQNPVVQHGDSLSLVINNYEWTLTEQGNEYEFGVDQLATNANNLAPALSALLANVGNVAQNNNNAIENILDTEAQSLGVDIENSGALASAASQYGSQLSGNSEAITAAAQDQYNQAASALAQNTNGITTQVNQQLNQAVQNQESLSATVSNAVNTAVANAGAVNNLAGDLPVQVTGNAAPLLNAANNVNTNQAAASLGNYANQALNAGSNVANANLPNNLANSVSGAASNAASSAASSIDSAASSLNANAVNNLGAAANLVNGQ